MLVVIALGAKALLRLGEPMTADVQRDSVRMAAEALAPIAAAHRLVIGHGNGPQVGVLALQAAAYAKVEAFPLDVLNAQTEGMVGYLLEQELRNLLPFARPLATLLTMVEVDLADPAFKTPSKFIGPVYLRDEAERIAHDKGWVFKSDGDKWRRVVASPEPKRIIELRPIQWLLDRNTVVLTAGGGGIPTTDEKGADRRLAGVECVIDRDQASELLARELGADLFVMMTDADAVYVDWGKPTQKAIRRGAAELLKAMSFAAESMAPKVDAACRFATSTGRTAAIGKLADLERIIAGQAGTTISASEPGLTYAHASGSIGNTAPA